MCVCVCVCVLVQDALGRMVAACFQVSDRDCGGSTDVGKLRVSDAVAIRVRNGQMGGRMGGCERVNTQGG